MKQKAVIFDIDETLLSVRNRRLKSFHLIPESRRFKKIPNVDCLSTLQRKDIRSYDLTKPLEKCNIPEKYHKKIEKRWKKNFSSNESIYHDNRKFVEKPIKGSVEIVNKYHDNGYHIIYMTGRRDIDKNKSMRWGTLDEMVKYNFPLTKNTTLIMKTSNEPNHKYKKKIARNLQQKYDVKAVFDDLPKNIEYIQNVFPNAKYYGLKRRSKCSEFPKGTICIKDFSTI